MRINVNPVGQYFLWYAPRDKGTRAMLTFYGWRYLRPFDGMPASWNTSDAAVAQQTATIFQITIERRNWDGTPA